MTPQILSVKTALWAILIICAIWLGGYLYFVGNLKISNLQSTPKADAIVILTGSAKRLKDGVQLMGEGKGARLLVSGVNLKVTKEELRLVSGQSEALMNCCTDLGRLARDTVGNARETKLWVKAHGFNSLIVVTSAYHLPRSMTELGSVMPDIHITGYGSRDEKIKLDHWWSNPGTAMVLIREFNKYIYSLVRARFK